MVMEVLGVLYFLNIKISSSSKTWLYSTQRLRRSIHSGRQHSLGQPVPIEQLNKTRETLFATDSQASVHNVMDNETLATVRVVPSPH
jgi:hypothetical protein